MYEVRIPKLTIEGPVAFHDQQCAVIEGEPAVYDMSQGVYLPSWAAQNQGWRLIRLRGPIQRLLYRWFFDE